MEDEGKIVANGVKSTLAAGGYSFGTWVIGVRTPAIVRMAGAAGFDFVLIDTEHSDLSWETMGTMCEMARACGVVPIIRPFDRSPKFAGRALDLGAMGLMYPDVRERGEIDEMLDAMRYPPGGSRGAIAYSAPMDYVVGPARELYEAIDESVLLKIQVESAESVDRIEELLAGGGVDVVELGRFDLSTSYGVPHETRHPKVLDAVERVVAACDAAGVAVGVTCYAMEDARDMVERGIRCITYSADRAILMNAYLAARAELDDMTETRV